MFHSERFYLDAVVLCGKGEEELKGISIGFNGIVAHPLDVREVLIEELMHRGGKLHSFLSCQRAKSTRFLRLCASATLR